MMFRLSFKKWKKQKQNKKKNKRRRNDDKDNTELKKENNYDKIRNKMADVASVV